MNNDYYDALDQDTRRWAMFCHLGALTVFTGIPGFVVPLIIWLVKRDDHPFINAHGRESLNFQISMMIYTTVLTIVAIILSFVLVGFLLFPLIGIMALIALILPIVAGIKANDGKSYRYPCTIPFLK